MANLRAAVIGVGRMGQHHARIYDTLPGVELVAVCDLDYTQATKIAEKYVCPWYRDHQRMLCEQMPDLVSVVVPTNAHVKVAQLAMEHGVHVLVEKPIADTIDGAKLLIETATARRLVLAVGHVERCNPVVREIKRLVDAGEIGRVYRVSTVRVGPDPVRVRDVGVVIDLATHDLDIMCYLLGQEPIISAVHLQHHEHGIYEDGVTAILRFPDSVGTGTVGSLQCDWLTPAKLRSITVVGSEGAILAQYGAQTGLLYRRGQEGAVALQVEQVEPLYLELAAFVAAVRDGSPPVATGEDGLVALRLAHAILREGERRCANCCD